MDRCSYAAGALLGSAVEARTKQRRYTRRCYSARRAIKANIQTKRDTSPHRVAGFAVKTHLEAGLVVFHMAEVYTILHHVSLVSDVLGDGRAHWPFGVDIPPDQS